MIDVHAPESKPLRVLPRETVRETRCRADFQIVEHNHGADGSVTKREEKSVLALGGIGRAVHENQTGLSQAGENIRRAGEIK